MLVANKTQFFSLDRIHGRDRAFFLIADKKKRLLLQGLLVINLLFERPIFSSFIRF